MWIISISIIALLSQSLIAQTTCPDIQCPMYDDTMETDNLCLWHSGDLPTTFVKIRHCNDNPNQICNLFDNKNDFAWPSSATQFRTPSTLQNPIQSPLYKKQTKVTCQDKNVLLETELLNGRKCLENYQCISRNCDWDTGICTGRGLNETCITHQDCSAGFACITNSAWPYNARCVPQLNEGQNCTSDLECKNNMGCIRPYQATGFQSPRCVKYFSLNDSTTFNWQTDTYPTLFNNNITKNAILDHGKFCKSGIANRLSINLTQCVTLDFVRLSSDPNGTIASPYPCRADSIVNCVYYTNRIPTERFRIPCDCGFDSQNGYCPIPDQSFMSQNAQLMFNALNQSLCHTLDRFNLFAQKDCGVGRNKTQWWNQETYKKMADSQFQLKYWTFTRTQEAYDCMTGVFPSSAQMVTASGLSLKNSLMFVVLMFLIVFYQ